MKYRILGNAMAGFLLLAGAGCRQPIQEVLIPDPMERIYADAAGLVGIETNSELILCGARNGIFSGQIVAVRKKPGLGPVAQASDLRQKGGSGVVPSSAIQVRYGVPDALYEIVSPNKQKRMAFDDLADAPLKKGVIHHIWVTVNVPANAPAGEYEGNLKVAGRRIPVRLKVADWTLPNPHEFQTWVDFIQSPESIALRYGVPLWSERHWELIGRSFELLAQAGIKVLYLPIIAHSNLGNEESMLRWVRAGETKVAAPEDVDPDLKEYAQTSGTGMPAVRPEFQYDYSILEKYVDIYLAKVGKPGFVILYFYEPYMGGGHEMTPGGRFRGVSVTVFDPATKQVSLYEGPSHNNATPAYPDFPKDSIAFWKAPIDGIRERLNRRGIEDTHILLGVSPDKTPLRPSVDWWVESFPWARWAHEGHHVQVDIGPMKCAFVTMLWSTVFPHAGKEESIEQAVTNRMHGWQARWKDHHGAAEGIRVCFYDRNIGTQLIQSRLLAEVNIAGKQCGFGRMTADLWPCIPAADGRKRRPISSRYPLSGWGNLNLKMKPYLCPGSDGPESTARFEMLKEGIQESEARIVIDQALVDPEKRAKLGDELAAQCQALLDDRTRVLIEHVDAWENRSADRYRTEAEFAKSGWQKRSEKLYDAAAQVTRILAEAPVKR